ASGQDRAQTASLDLERRRLVPLAVNDAGHVSRAAQAASGAGAALDARLDREGGSLAGHRGGILGTGARCCPTLGEMAEEPKDRSIPRGRLRRSARVGVLAGVEGVRYAGTKATNIVRSKNQADARMEQLAVDTADRLVETLGRMKGAAMKMGQLASFIDTDYLPEEFRELYQEKLAKLRTAAPAMPWEKVRKVLVEEYDDPYEELFAEIETEAFAAASIGQVHR